MIKVLNTVFLDVDYYQDQLQRMEGARDMLREAAKQFRASKIAGHARMCELHADNLDEVLNNE